MHALELQQTAELLKSEHSKTERLQGFLEHAESDIEQLTNQLEEHKARISTLESDKNSTARQLQAAKTGRSLSTFALAFTYVSVQRLNEAVRNFRKNGIRRKNWRRSFNAWNRTSHASTRHCNRGTKLYLPFNSRRQPSPRMWSVSEPLSRVRPIIFIIWLSADMTPTELHEVQAKLKEELSKVEAKDARIHDLEASLQELSTRTEQQQQTISLLVSEKTALTSSVERLQDAESSMSHLLLSNTVV